jgi:hypothetical protein
VPGAQKKGGQSLSNGAGGASQEYLHGRDASQV